MNSYGILIVTEGDLSVNDIHLTAGDRVFVSENEKKLNIIGNGTIFICQP